MQLSAPHGSIVILGGSRLFWIVCEAQWVTESTFTLTHACDIINLAVARVGTHTHTHAHTHTHMHATGADKNDAQKKLTHTDKYTLNTLRALTSKASRWAGLFFSPPLSRTHRAPGWRRGPSVSQHCPLPRSLFLGMAALSSWLGWSSLYADSKPLAVWSCQEFIILHGGSFPPLSHQWKHESHFFLFILDIKIAEKTVQMLSENKQHLVTLAFTMAKISRWTQFGSMELERSVDSLWGWDKSDSKTNFLFADQ